MNTWTWTWITMGITSWQTGLVLFWWIICNFGIFMIGYLEQQNDPGLSQLNDPIGNSIFFSRGAGLALMLQAMLIFLPVCRNILALLRQVKWMRKVITFDKNIHFHKVIAWTMLIFTAVHSFAHLVNFYWVERLKMTILKKNNSALFLLWNHPAGYTGVILLSIMFLMYTSSLHPIRRQCFELFWYIHHLAFPFMVTLCLHPIGCFVKRRDGNCKPYGTWTVAVFGLGIYVLERILREVRSRQLTTITKAIRHPGDTIEIQFKKSQFSYLPGQYIFVNIPDVSRLEWHPFTLTSAPEEDHVSVHIRIVGDWTKKMANRLGYYEGSNKLDASMLPVLRVDGPFGTPSQQVYDYETVVLVGAGIGVTPFASILKSMWFRSQNQVEKRRMRVRKCHFFWTARDTDAFSWFQSLISAVERDMPKNFLSIHIYLTGKLKADQLTNVMVQSKQADDPITLLKSRTKFGRPDFDTFFSSMRKEESKGEVGVFFCGPHGLKVTLEKACKKNTTSDYLFRFHPEKF